MDDPRNETEKTVKPDLETESVATVREAYAPPQTDRNEHGSDRDDGSPWAPFRYPVYRSFWIAALFSNLGSWMHEIGAGWLMTDLDSSPQMVSAVRTAMATPIVLLAIPAGALADRVDRRKLLLATQFLMLATAAALAVLTVTGAMTSWLLLALTFLIGLGLTVHVPAWQASIPELIPRAQLSRAIALGSINFNLARSAGPAIAGVLVALTGSWIAFSFNALSFAGVVLVLLFWRRERRESSRGLSYRLSLYQGLRYAYRTAAMRHVLIRVALFIVPASALWGLLPLVARERLDWGAGGFGILVTCVGAGALVAAQYLPRLQRQAGFDRTITLAMVFFAIGLAVMATTTQRWWVAASAVVMGCGWMMTLTTLNTAAQMTLRSRMRARGMSCYLMAIALSMSTGSIFWGSVAESFGIDSAQKIAAATILATAAIGVCFPVGSAQSQRKSEPAVSRV